MKTSKSNLVTYKREKGKVEITGEADQIKNQVWFDLITSRLMWLVLIIVLLIIAPKTSWVPLVWQWLKKQIPLLILLLVQVDYLQVLLSG
jgi:hypothetical protein